MLAEAAAGVVEDVIGDDGRSGSEVDDAVGQVVEDKETGSGSLYLRCIVRAPRILQLLADQREVGLLVEFVGTYEHRVAAGGFTAFGIDILACEGLGEPVGVHAAYFLHVVDEGEAVSVVQVDEHVLAVTVLQVAEGRVVAEGADVLHVAEQLLVLAGDGEGIEGMLRAAESGMIQSHGTQRTRLTGGLVIVEGDAVTEIPVEGRDEQGAVGTDGVEDGLEELVTIKALTVTHTGKGELHDVRREQHAVALLQSPVLGEFEITNVRHTSPRGLLCCRRNRSSQERRPCRRCGS